jgi:hypothetical protein
MALSTVQDDSIAEAPDSRVTHEMIKVIPNDRL